MKEIYIDNYFFIYVHAFFIDMFPDVLLLRLRTAIKLLTKT